MAELNLELILESNDRPSIKAVPKFPSIRRDFSLLVESGTRYCDIEKAVHSVDIPELVHVEPFDRLEHGPFPESKYALAISLTYRSPERTLTDEEVAGFDKAILDSLKQRLDAELRQ
jgi:phenylalanyl-tRNA synthetase beta chain